MFQQSHFWAFIQRNWNHCLKETSASPCSCTIIHSSQDMETTLIVTSWMDNGNMACSAIKRMKSSHLWNSMDEITVIMWDKRSQAEKDKYSLVSVVCGIWRGESWAHRTNEWNGGLPGAHIKEAYDHLNRWKKTFDNSQHLLMTLNNRDINEKWICLIWQRISILKTTATILNGDMLLCFLFFLSDGERYKDTHCQYLFLVSYWRSSIAQCRVGHFKWVPWPNSNLELICMCRLPHTSKQFLDATKVSENSTQFWHFLPGDRIRFQR